MKSCTALLAALLVAGMGLTAPALAASDADAGKALYGQNCATCHQADGSGVPDFQPALTDSSIVNGPKAVLIHFVLTGDRPTPSDTPWMTVMPTFETMSDDDLAQILTYVRTAFGGADETDVTPDDVAKTRNVSAQE